MNKKEPSKNPIIEKKRRGVSTQAEAEEPSRTIEKLEEARKIAAALQEERKSGTELKTNLVKQVTNLQRQGNLKETSDQLSPMISMYIQFRQLVRLIVCKRHKWDI
uniref:Uncharacterized protein n=1 Tax=Glyptapanteles indiensis TaxID=92994 RepID=B7S951_GLYIN|nr:hypothetical protein GIP_L8_0400 [Glyptapanteles indiensis]